MSLTIENYSRKIVYPQSNTVGKQFNEFVGLTIEDERPLVGFIEAFPTSTSQTGRDWSQTKPQQHFLVGPAFKESEGFTRPLGKVKALPAFTCQPLHSFQGLLFGRDNGEDLTSADAWTGPRTAVLVTSADGEHWVQRGTFGIDPTKNTAQFSRIKDNHVLGGIRATGQLWPAPAGTRSGIAGTDPCLQISADGKTWKNGLFFAAGQKAMTFFNEWDSAELPNGDLAVMVRCGQGWKRQGAFADNAEKKAQLSSIYAFAIWPARDDGTGWNYVEPKKVPWSTTANPIHPALILDRLTGGLVFASQGSEGFRVTYDRGATWGTLSGVAPTNYYPVLAQGPDGTLWCASHVGGDDDINETDQQIVVQSFKLNDPSRPPVDYSTPPTEEPTIMNVTEVARPGGVAWTNIANAAANDSNYAAVNLPGNAVESNFVAIWGPDAFADVPDDHIITTLAFRARVRRGATGSNQTLRNGPAALLKGTQTVASLPRSETNWASVAEHDEVFTFTGLEIKGSTAKSADFGWAVSFYGTGTPVQAQLNSFGLISVAHRPQVVVDPPPVDPPDDPSQLEQALARIAELESELAAANLASQLLSGDLDSALADLDRLETAVDGALALLKPLRPVA